MKPNSKKKPRRGRGQRIAVTSLPQRSQSARDRAMHAIAAMRRDAKLSLSHAAKLQGVKPATVKKYFSSLLIRSKGKLRVTKSDRAAATLYVPDANGRAIPVHTRSSKDRKALSRYLRDVGRYLGGKRNALAPWRGKTVAGIELVTSAEIIISIEPALSEFSLYRSTNGGA
jgi:hypothetical protein